MKKLLRYLNGLSPVNRRDYAKRAGTTEAYLRKSVSVNQRLSAELALALARESGGNLTLADIRADLVQLLSQSGFKQQTNDAQG